MLGAGATRREIPGGFSYGCGAGAAEGEVTGAPAGAAVHHLKSCSETIGSFFMNATIFQISGSSTPASLKLGMPVMLMPFLTTQNSSRGWRSGTISLRSGGSGRNPSDHFCHSTPGAPWQFTQPRWEKAFAPACTEAGVSYPEGG